jgi:hypothetical protein
MVLARLHLGERAGDALDPGETRVIASPALDHGVQVEEATVLVAGRHVGDVGEHGGGYGRLGEPSGESLSELDEVVAPEADLDVVGAQHARVVEPGRHGGGLAVE